MYRVLTFVVTSLLLFIGNANAQTSRATFYQLPNYQGRSFVVYGDGGLSNLSNKRRGSSGNWNDKISSVYIEGDMTVTLFRDRSYKGPALTIRGSIPRLFEASSQFNWDSAASSLTWSSGELRDIGYEATMFDDPNFTGHSFLLGAGDAIADLNDKRRGSALRDWNNEIESLRVPSSVYVVLYDGTYFTGSYAVFSGSSSNLARIGWKKRASSIAVFIR